MPTIAPAPYWGRATAAETGNALSGEPVQQASKRGAAAAAPLSTIMIAEDEVVVRENMRDLIDWRSLGFRLVGDYPDGERALAAALQQRPDAIITDIRMPHIDGLELTRRLAADLPDTSVLLLTGHDEFEYAQAAVRLQVWDFVLKPISSRGLSEVLSRLRSDLIDLAARREALALLRRQWRRHLPLLQERVLNELVSGDHTAAELDRRLSDVGLSLHHERYRIAVISIDLPDGDEPYATTGIDPRDDPGLAQIALSSACAELVSTPLGAIQFGTPAERLVLLIPDRADQVSERLDAFRKRLPHDLGFAVTIGLSLEPAPPQEIRAGYIEAQRAIGQRLISGGNQIYSRTTDEQAAAVGGGQRGIAAQELAARIRALERDGALAALSQILDRCSEHDSAAESCMLTLQLVLAYLLTAVEDLGVRPEEVLDQHNPFVELAELPGIAAVRDWFTRLIDRVFALLAERSTSRSKRLVERAKAHIDRLFADYDLSLTDVCEALGVSVSHFSARFKELTGKTFIEYLTQTRMERAKTLLLEGELHTYQIAEAVGFRDPHYFSSSFKRATGTTPTQFRASGGAQQEP